MEGMESKKLALLRILQILHDYSDSHHPLTQEDIADYLDRDYGIIIERKAVGRNISLLKEAGYDIASTRSGCYLEQREFEDAELHLLIDGVLCSKHIPARYSKELIERISRLSNRYFKAGTRNIFSVNDWNKTDNPAIFYNIQMIDSAIAHNRQIRYDYNKFGVDKKMHKSSEQTVSPYQMILHNQRYYLMAYSEYWGSMVFHRLDHMTNMKMCEEAAIPVRSVQGYENGIDYRKLSSALPYLYTDTPERIELRADVGIVDQIVDWFGRDVKLWKDRDNASKVGVLITASPAAMEHWVMQYCNYVEVVAPAALREKILKNAQGIITKYQNSSTNMEVSK